MINPYQILGFKPEINIPISDIRKKYRQLCIENHQDKGGDQANFKLINQAYKILSDKKLREKFHASLPKTGDELKELSRKELGDQDTKYSSDFSEKDLKKFNQKFMRPTEVDYLIGDASKAKEKLGWSPKTTFSQLVKKMVVNDISLLETETL